MAIGNCLLNAIHFCMRVPIKLVVSFADDLPFMYQHSSNQGVWGYMAGAQLCQLQAAPHKILPCMKWIIAVHRPQM